MQGLVAQAMSGLIKGEDSEAGYTVLNRLIDQVTRATAEAMPRGMNQELESNLRAALQSVFDRLDLVTREELEVQEAVLARTRARLAELEARIVELEARLPGSR